MYDQRNARGCGIVVEFWRDPVVMQAVQQAILMEMAALPTLRDLFASNLLPLSDLLAKAAIEAYRSSAAARSHAADTLYQIASCETRAIH